MTETADGYAVFLYDQAVEVLGEAIKPFLKDGPGGTHIPCLEVDTGGAFVEMTLRTRPESARDAAIELMVPSGMVRMIASMRTSTTFGFAATHLEPGLTALPAVGPDAPAPEAPSTAMPHVTVPSGANATIEDDRRRPPEG
ncbi:MAG TPA: hypothetical protein VIG88_07810 [Lysobacter sp.]